MALLEKKYRLEGAHDKVNASVDSLALVGTEESNKPSAVLLMVRDDKVDTDSKSKSATSGDETHAATEMCTPWDPSSVSLGGQQQAPSEGSVGDIVRGTTVNSTSDQPSGQNEKCVRFGQIEIYSHDVILGDNPSVFSGPPVTIGWKLLDTDTIRVDDYEYYRPERRHRDSLLLLPSQRESRLVAEGYTRRELRRASFEVQMTKKQPQLSSNENGFKKLYRLLAGPRKERATSN